MKKILSVEALPVLLGALFLASTAHAQEHKLQRSQLPAQVAATIDKQAQGALVRAYATEREHGKKVYEAETILNGHTRDLQVAEDGTLNEIEEEVQLAALPTAVQKALTIRAASGTILMIESLTKRGKLVAYEAVVQQKGKRKSEIQVGPAGERLAHEQ